MAGLGLSNQWYGGGVRVVQLPLITMETEWQSHREQESGALGQPPVFKERREGRIPSRAGEEGERKTYSFPAVFNCGH